MRVVLDTNVLVASRRSSRGASSVLMQFVQDRRIIPLITIALFLEYEAVLKRYEHDQANGLRAVATDEALANFAALAEPVNVHFRWRPQLSDPADELVLDAAVNGHADALVTHNIRDLFVVEERFGIRVLSPSDILELFRS
jgi:putative PIN family toxin of toxin-antitoxin system